MWVKVGVTVGRGVRVGVTVAVKFGFRVAVGEGVSVGVREGVRVGAGVNVLVCVGVRDRAAVASWACRVAAARVASALRFSVGEGRGVRVVVGVREAVGVRVGEGVLEGVRLGPVVWERSAVGVRVTAGVRVSVGTAVEIGEETIVTAVGEFEMDRSTGTGVRARIWFATGSPNKAEATVEENKTSARSSHCQPASIYALRVR